MPTAPNRTSEYEISVAVLQILIDRPDGAATLPELRRFLPRHIDFTDDDNELSDKRPGEHKWEQVLRNIQPHHDTPGNFIFEGYLRHLDGGGYAITAAGRRFIAKPDE